MCVCRCSLINIARERTTPTASRTSHLPSVEQGGSVSSTKPPQESRTTATRKRRSGPAHSASTEADDTRQSTRRTHHVTHPSPPCAGARARCLGCTPRGESCHGLCSRSGVARPEAQRLHAPPTAATAAGTPAGDQLRVAPRAQRASAAAATRRRRPRALSRHRAARWRGGACRARPARRT